MVEPKRGYLKTLMAAGSLLAATIVSTQAVAQLPNRCVAHTIARCKADWAQQGYPSLVACTNDQIQFCPPETSGGGGIGFWICREVGDGNVTCEYMG